MQYGIFPNDKSRNEEIQTMFLDLGGVVSEAAGTQALSNRWKVFFFFLAPIHLQLKAERKPHTYNHLHLIACASLKRSHGRSKNFLCETCSEIKFNLRIWLTELQRDPVKYVLRVCLAGFSCRDTIVLLEMGTVASGR